MSEITLNEKIARRLREAAHRYDVSVEQLIERMLDRLSAPGASPLHSLAALAESASAAGIEVAPDDISIRSREILQSERAGHLTRWKDDQIGDG
jgi:hypothetical protein